MVRHPTAGFFILRANIIIESRSCLLFSHNRVRLEQLDMVTIANRHGSNRCQISTIN